MKKKIHMGIAAVGVIFLLAGFWYAAVEAGLPYQDPTPEMLEQYNRSMTIGAVLLMTGGIVVLAELIYWGMMRLHRFVKRGSHS